MTLVEFTAYADIRAALGVAVAELKDDTLGLPLYELNLLEDLDDVDVGVIPAFKGVMAKSPASRSEAEERLYRSVRLFATYSVAKHLTSTLPLFSPKEITDGKASTGRYAGDPYKETIKKVEQLYEKWRTRLPDALSKVTSQSVVARGPRTLAVRSTPSSDPVLGT